MSEVPRDPLPQKFREWLDTRALTVVPVAAAELLEGVVELRLELDRTRSLLHELVRRDSPTPWADVVALQNHEAKALGLVAETAASVIGKLSAGQNADEEFRAWRQAVGRYERRAA